MAALAVATDIPEREKAYGHIIYNATLTHWRVTRYQQRQGYSQKVLKSSLKLLETIEKVDDSEVDKQWMIDMYVQMGYCCYDSGDSGRAKSFIEKAIDIACTTFPEDVPMRLRLLK
jgi:hypothetical protein